MYYLDPHVEAMRANIARMSASEKSAYENSMNLHFQMMYGGPRTPYIFKVPSVVPNQRLKFDTDEQFQELRNETTIIFTGLMGKTMPVRQEYFRNICDNNDNIDIAFAGKRSQAQLVLTPSQAFGDKEIVRDFAREHGKVHLRSHFVMNGVCVIFSGWLSVRKLEGLGRLEFDERRAAHEDVIARKVVDDFFRLSQA